MTTSSEILDGSVDLSSLQPGSSIDVETRGHHYCIEYVNGETRISGHPEYCPDPIPVHLQGSLDQQGRLDVGVIEPGMRLMFFVNERPVITSRIVHVQVDHPKAN
ncbi:MAG TPA: hypothetical protein VGG72_25125 [Bryobacteraceae bacterium]|jgi:hypothetical protein